MPLPKVLRPEAFPRCTWVACSRGQKSRISWPCCRWRPPREPPRWCAWQPRPGIKCRCRMSCGSSSTCERRIRPRWHGRPCMPRGTVWQFLNFCRRQPRGQGVPVLRLLDRIRRLVLLSEDRGLSQLPRSAESIDAVRLMTIHGSKGLEFDAVHLPGMVTSGLPRNNVPPRCLPPDGLIHGSEGLTGIEAVKAGHDEEEECLFFVALSRARDRLLLYSYAKQADGRARSPSRFVAPIERFLARPAFVPLRAGPPSTGVPLSITWQGRPQWTDIQVNLFERCPRRFLYTHVLRLGGRRTETAFMKMHNVVNDVFEWLKREHETTSPTVDELAARFEEAWRSKGAAEHGYAEDYRRIGRRLVDFLIESRSRGVSAPASPIS